MATVNSTVIPYLLPQRWAYYDERVINAILPETKAAVLSLKRIPYQKAWVEELQQVQLKREIAGTSKIEGADFTEGELDAVLKDSVDDLHTRAQKPRWPLQNTPLVAGSKYPTLGDSWR